MMHLRNMQVSYKNRADQNISAKILFKRPRPLTSDPLVSNLVCTNIETLPSRLAVSHLRVHTKLHVTITALCGAPQNYTLPVQAPQPQLISFTFDQDNHGVQFPIFLLLHPIRATRVPRNRRPHSRRSFADLPHHPSRVSLNGAKHHFLRRIAWY